MVLLAHLVFVRRRAESVEKTTFVVGIGSGASWFVGVVRAVLIGGATVWVLATIALHSFVAVEVTVGSTSVGIFGAYLVAVSRI